MDREQVSVSSLRRAGPMWFQREDGRNSTLLEAFEWHTPADQQHWRRLHAILPDLARIGIDYLWLPPGCKASGPGSNGYDVYDLYDLGEFDWKGCRATKWGPKEDLVALAAAADELKIGLLWDAVLSHKAAADSKERVTAVEVDPTNRNKAIAKPTEIEAWVRFEFPGRQGRYSTLKYHKEHFSGVDYDARSKKKAIFRLKGKKWATDVDDENGNSDYLMFSNLDYSNHEVRKDVTEWSSWIGGQISLAGMRLDAVRHVSEGFVQEFISHVRARQGASFVFIGEYWKGSLPALRSYLARQSHSLCLFDVPLVYNLAKISKSPYPDLRAIFKGTLLSIEPNYAISCVTNHDSQFGQALSPDATIERAFLLSAYALILLRAAGMPCVFYGDLYGTSGPQGQEHIRDLPILCAARARYSYGKQRDYFDDPNCIGWTREGSFEFSDGAGLAVLVCCSAHRRSSSKRVSPQTSKKMYVGKKHANETWKDILGSSTETIRIDENGAGKFKSTLNSVAVWVNTLAPGLADLGAFDAKIYEKL